MKVRDVFSGDHLSQRRDDQVRAREVTISTMEHARARQKGTKIGNTEATTA